MALTAKGRKAVRNRVAFLRSVLEGGQCEEGQSHAGCRWIDQALWRAAVPWRGSSFRINRGECVGLLGPNGAGKTSTLAMIGGIARPDGGAVRDG